MIKLLKRRLLRAVAAFAVEIIGGEREFAVTIAQTKRLSKLEDGTKKCR
jgi:hypothetical protein